jgi:hypothetical protein
VPGDPNVGPAVPGDPNVDPAVPGDPNVGPAVPGDPNVGPAVPGDPNVGPAVPGDLRRKSQHRYQAPKLTFLPAGATDDWQYLAALFVPRGKRTASDFVLLIR